MRRIHDTAALRFFDVHGTAAPARCAALAALWMLTALAWLALPGAAAAQDPMSSSARSQTPAPPAPPPPPATLTKLPRLVKSTAAPYPPRALAEGRSASVGLELLVDAMGQVASAKVKESAGAEFDEAALTAARTFVFEPAQAGGKPVPVRIDYRYRFVLETKTQVVEKPAPPQPQERIEAVAFEGTLLERGTRKPLPGVRVYVVKQGVIGRSDERGRFLLRGLAPGAYELTARTPAHRRLTESIRVPFSGAGRGTFYLRKRPYDPYETIIRAAREEERPVQRTLRLEEISKIPGVQGDALKVVQNLPGVARVPFGLGGLIIRGSSPQDSLAFLDGHPIPQLFHFLGLRSTFASDILERIDFVPGNFSADYGRLTGGILDVATRAPNTCSL